MRHAHGRRRGARVQDAHVRDRGARARARHLGDGQPADRQGPRRRHDAVLVEVPRDRAVAAARLRAARRRQGVPDLAGAHERHPQGGALHQLRLLRLRVQRDGGRPGVPRPAGAREGDALRRRPARGESRRAARGRTTPSTASGTARGATSATSAARRASTRATRSRSSAPSRSSTASTATWARSTRSGSSPPRRRRAGCARRSSCRRRRASSRRSSRPGSRSGSRSTARCRCRCRRTSRRTSPQARALYDIVKAQGRDGALGIVQGERALSRLEHGHDETRRRARSRTARARSRGRSFPGENGPPAGGDQGMGSRTQADVTPGAEPTRKPGGGA